MPSALAHPPADALAPDAPEETVPEAAAERSDPPETAKPEPSVLDRFLWTVVKEVDEEAVLGFMFTKKESRRLHALERKKESGKLSQEEELEHFDLKLASDCMPLLKAAIYQKRGGWTGGGWTGEPS